MYVVLNIVTPSPLSVIYWACNSNQPFFTLMLGGPLNASFLEMELFGVVMQNAVFTLLINTTVKQCKIMFLFRNFWLFNLICHISFIIGSIFITSNIF